MNILAPLARPPIALFWSGQLVSSTGDDMYRVVMAWMAASLAGSAAGWLWSAQSLTMFAVSLLAGVLVDRWDCRRTLIATSGLRGLVVLAIPMLTLAGAFEYWHMWLVVVGFAGLRAIELPAQQAILPLVAPGNRMLLALNALMDSTKRLSRIVGPGIAAALALVMPVEHVLFAVAAVWGLAAVANALSRPAVPGVHVHLESRGGLAGIVREFVTGVRAVAAHRLTSWAMIGVALNNVAWANAFLVGLVLLSQERFPGDVGAYGLIVAAYGAGNLLGTVVFGSLPFARQVRCLFPGRIVWGVGFISVALAPDLPLTMAGVAFAAIGAPMADLAFVGTMQRAFAPGQIGRIYGLRVTSDSFGGVIGALISAPLLAWWSPATLTAAAGAMLALFGAVALAWGPAAVISPSLQGAPADD